MPADPKIDLIKQQLDEVQADDVAEDAAYEATIASLTAERDALQAERAGIVADLISQRDALDARITALGG